MAKHIKQLLKMSMKKHTVYLTTKYKIEIRTSSVNILQLNNYTMTVLYRAQTQNSVLTMFNRQLYNIYIIKFYCLVINC